VFKGIGLIIVYTSIAIMSVLITARIEIMPIQ
jgi:hypothetical protein